MEQLLKILEELYESNAKTEEFDDGIYFADDDDIASVAGILCYALLYDDRDEDGLNWDNVSTLRKHDYVMLTDRDEFGYPVDCLRYLFDNRILAIL